ncbi:MAG TPA: FAD-dependent oxidoreductase, partial [Candidatus Acidoferrales bacterium]|nr:FAD-dependent oxidoreductase [Candidatus Acidoferrales bacterium]
MTTAAVAVVGAGMAGIAVAHELAVRRGIRDVVLIDERAPLTLTSDKSSECYRNWWPGPDDAMVALMNDSIDRLEALADESGDAFHMNRRGYVWATADPSRAGSLRRDAEESSRLGAGPLRVHEGTSRSAYVPPAAAGVDRGLTGADLLLDPALIREHFPYLDDDVVAVLHARRCGWMSAQQLGMYLIERARDRGLRLLRARVEGIDVRDDQVVGVRTSAGTVATEVVVDAAGPYAADLARGAGVELPAFNELHGKVAFRDDRQAIPRGAPFLIWADPVRLWTSDAERGDVPAEWLTRTYPSGAHLRPEGGPRSDALLLIWSYEEHREPPKYPITYDPSFAEICLRGLARMIPRLADYVGHAPRPVIDGGYYTRTEENRPIIGPLPMRGLYASCAFGGFGIMA